MSTHNATDDIIQDLTKPPKYKVRGSSIRDWRKDRENPVNNRRRGYDEGGSEEEGWFTLTCRCCGRSAGNDWHSITYICTIKHRDKCKQKKDESLPPCGVV